MFFVPFNVAFSSFRELVKNLLHFWIMDPSQRNLNYLVLPMMTELS